VVAVCRLLRDGVAAVFGPTIAETSRHVQAVCDVTSRRSVTPSKYHTLALTGSWTTTMTTTFELPLHPATCTRLVFTRRTRQSADLSSTSSSFTTGIVSPYSTTPTTVSMPCLHDRANIEQTSSKCIQNTRANCSTSV